MRTKLWVGVGAFVVAQSGQTVIAEAAAAPSSIAVDQQGEGGENERGEGEGERHVVRRTNGHHLVKNPRRLRAAQQHRGQRGEGENEGGEHEGGEGEGER